MEGHPERDERHLRRLADPEPDDEQRDRPAQGTVRNICTVASTRSSPSRESPEASASAVPTTPPSSSPTTTRWSETPIAAGNVPSATRSAAGAGDGPGRGEHIRMQHPCGAEHLPQHDQQQRPHRPSHPPRSGPQPRPAHGRRNDRLQLGRGTRRRGGLLRSEGRCGWGWRMADGHGGSTEGRTDAGRARDRGHGEAPPYRMRHDRPEASEQTESG